MSESKQISVQITVMASDWGSSGCCDRQRSWDIPPADGGTNYAARINGGINGRFNLRNNEQPTEWAWQTFPPDDDDVFEYGVQETIGGAEEAADESLARMVQKYG